MRPMRCSTWGLPTTSRRSSRATPKERQTVLFSATLPPRVDKIARRHLRQPARIFIQQAAEGADQAPLVRQTAYIVARAHKPAALGRILDVEAPTAAIVFCRTRIEVDQLTETLNGRGLPGRGPSRRTGSGATGSGHGSTSHRRHRAAGCHRRRSPGPRHRPAHSCRQLRRSLRP